MRSRVAVGRGIGRVALPGLLMLASASPALAQSTDGRLAKPAIRASVRAAILYGDGPIAGVSPVPGSTVSAETGSLRFALKGRPPDRWLGFDKVQHAAFSFLWTLSSQYVLVNKIDVSERRALPVAIGTGALFGLTKEIYDWRLGPHRSFSYRDLAADAFGITLAVGLILL